jgi:hypothetical protein
MANKKNMVGMLAMLTFGFLFSGFTMESVKPSHGGPHSLIGYSVTSTSDTASPLVFESDGTGMRDGKTFIYEVGGGRVREPRPYVGFTPFTGTWALTTCRDNG